MYSLVLMMALGNGSAAPAFDGIVDRPDTQAYANHSHNLYRHKRHGCCGGGCSGRCHGGCHGGYSSCCGCWGGGYGCHGGYASYGCHGGYASYGCTGGYYGGSGCTGGHYGASYGGYGVMSTGGYYSEMPLGTTYQGGIYGGSTYTLPMPSEGYYEERRSTDDRSHDANKKSNTDTNRNRDQNRDQNRDRSKEGRSGDEQARAESPATIVVSLPADAKLLIDDQPTASTSALRTFVTPDLRAGQDFRYTLKAELTRDGRTLTTSKPITVRAGEETRVTVDFPNGNVAQR